MVDEVTLILPPSPIKHQGQTFDLRVIFEGKLPTSLLFNATILNGRVTMVLTVHEPLYTCWYTILYEYCKSTRNFLRDAFIFTLLLLCVNIFLLSWGGRAFFLENIILLALIGYEVIISNSYPTRSRGILSNVDCECSRS